MKRYAVLNIHVMATSPGEEDVYHHPFDVELDGAFNDLDDAKKCYVQFGSDVIVDCSNGSLVEMDNE